jgi:paraquat-inducible protein B
MDNREELIKKIADSINETAQITELNEILKHNFISFVQGNRRYRIRKPKQEELQELGVEKSKYYSSLLKDNELMFEKEVRARLKEKKGVDVEQQYDKRIEEIQKKIENLYLRLVSVTDAKDIKKIEDEIKSNIDEQAAVASDRYELLSCSIENLISTMTNGYLIYLCLEVSKSEDANKEPKEEDWERAFASYQDFKNCQDDVLIIKAVNVLSLLIQTNGIR